jgi:hypothetical protein
VAEDASWSGGEISNDNDSVDPASPAGLIDSWPSTVAIAEASAGVDSMCAESFGSTATGSG